MDKSARIVTGMAIGTGAGVVAGVLLFGDNDSQGAPGTATAPSIYSGNVLGVPCAPIVVPVVPVCLGVSAAGGTLKFTDMHKGMVKTAKIGTNSTYKVSLPPGNWTVSLLLPTTLGTVNEQVVPGQIIVPVGQQVVQDFTFSTGFN
jgi:hypothetical protein